MIVGPSGSGKSGLALELMSRGAALIADDRTVLTRRDGVIHLSAPETISGMIEARGIGILNAQTTTADLFAVVDLAQDEPARLPSIRKRNLLGVEVVLLHNCASPYFPAGLIQYLKAGRRE